VTTQLAIPNKKSRFGPKVCSMWAYSS